VNLFLNPVKARTPEPAPNKVMVDVRERKLHLQGMGRLLEKEGYAFSSIFHMQTFALGLNRTGRIQGGGRGRHKY
jgi:hypothetical protein